MIKNVVQEFNSGSNMNVQYLLDLDVEVECDLEYPEMREDGYQPDYHAGAIETSQVNAFFPEKIRRDVALTLTPSNSFEPLAYCGDPASYEKEINVAEICSVDVKIDALKIKKLLAENSSIKNVL